MLPSGLTKNLGLREGSLAQVTLQAWAVPGIPEACCSHTSEQGAPSNKPPFSHPLLRIRRQKPERPGAGPRSHLQSGHTSVSPARGRCKSWGQRLVS